MSSQSGNRQTQFHVSHLGQNYGPWTMQEIADRVSRMELLGSDFVFDESRGDWIPLLESSAFLSEVQTRKPSAPPSTLIKSAVSQVQVTAPAATAEAGSVLHSLHSVKTPSVSSLAQTNSRWQLIRGRNRIGPMMYVDILKGLQEKKIFSFDFLQKEGESIPKPLAEIAEFQTETIRELIQDPAAPSVFFQRQHPRFAYMNEVMVHNNRQVWMAQTYQASEGGSGLIIQTAGLMPGQVVKLHYASHDGLPAFNVQGEIVSKKFAREQRSIRAAVPYGVRFLELRREIREVFADYVNRREVG